MTGFGFTVFIILIFLLYGLISYWIGRRGRQWLTGYFPNVNVSLYWVVLCVAAIAYPVGRFGREILPWEISSLLIIAGSFWMGAIIYFTLALLFIDAVRLLVRITGIIKLPAPVFLQAPVVGLAVVLLVAGTLAYGWWNARSPRITQYNVNIPRAGEVQNLKLVAVSDLHLGEVVNRRRLEELVNMINDMDPDLVLLPGDIIEETPVPFARQDMASVIRSLSPKYGVYAVPGNHEYIGGRAEEILSRLEGAGVKVLKDRKVKVADSFYIVGRDDLTGGRFTGKPRLELNDLLTGMDLSLPVILMDHQPAMRGRDPEPGVDLKISGHTHRGQFFPFNLITKKIYETDWGYLKRGELNMVVTSGYGTFGPPIRVGSRPEVVFIDITFGTGPLSSEVKPME
ncbi:MAG: hypothetical protein VR68_02655 [Peptococcaceae bacterium BRH_c4a]|nr:MAG: hypothetical protein VR68_02655 [Peptococcaceae bacterium BRH_c4a]